MNKKEFLNELKFALSKSNDKDDIVNYYDELISDKIEEGNDEVEVINSLGSIEDILKTLNIQTSKKIKYDSIINPKKEVIVTKKEVSKKSHLPLILIIIGFPIWFPLLIAIFSIAFSLFVALFCIFITFAIFPVCGVITSIYSLFLLNSNGGLLFLGASITLIGIGLIIAPITLKITKLLWDLLILLFSKLFKQLGGNK